MWSRPNPSRDGVFWRLEGKSKRTITPGGQSRSRHACAPPHGTALHKAKALNRHQGFGVDVYNYERRQRA